MASIEIFPNELLIELFEYFSPYDLYRLFFNLNFRFNTIISSLYNFHFILHEDWDQKDRLTPFFASQISTLIIKHDDLIDFSSYSNLRSLKLSMPTMIQCNAIRSFLLPNLEHLCIANFFFSDYSEQLCRLIFSPAFSRLQTCQIDRMTLNRTHSSFSSSLRQLTLSPGTWKSNLYRQLFQACPELTHLRVQRLRNLSFAFASNDFLLHSSLRHLDIHFYSIGNDWFNHIDWLLSMSPNLKDMTLRIDQSETNVEFPFDFFARLLTERVPDLLHFKAKIPLTKFLSKEFDGIKSLHALFVHVQFQRYINRSLNNYLIISSEQ